MYSNGISAPVRTASSLRLPILLTLLCLVITITGEAMPQDANGANKTDKIDAISKRLEALERQIETLKRENAELRKKFGELETPTLARAAEVTRAEGLPKAPAVSPDQPALDLKSTAPEPRAAAVAGQNEPQKKDSRIEFGGEIRLRPEVTDNDPNRSIVGVDSFVRQRVRLRARASLTDNLSGFAEIQDSRLWGNEFSTTGSIANLDLHQAYIQADRFLAPGLSLRIGRQELSYGSERLVGASDWDNVGRSFDALKAVFARKSWSIDFFASRVVDAHGFAFIVVPRQGTLGLDEDEDPYFLSPPPHQEFYGAYLKLLNDNPHHKLEAYAFLLRDNFASLGENRSRADATSTSIYTMGGRQESRFEGGFYFNGEAAFQTGHLGPDDHLAVGLSGRVGKYFKAASAPHFGFEYAFATGDSNSRDGDSREFIDLFPTNHTHHGFMDLLGWRNLHDYRLNFGLNPANKLSFDADYHKFLLHQAGGRWSNAAGGTLGFDPNGVSSKQLGQEIDLTVRFPYREHLKFMAGYSVFLPGRFAKLTRQTSDISHFSYIQTLISF